MNPYALENASTMPIIDAGVSNIRLGLFTRLSRSYKRRSSPDQATPLAFCVVRRIFLESVDQTAVGKFASGNAERIEIEVSNALADAELREAIALVYAARIVQLGWETCDPFNERITGIVEMATRHGIEIPQIVDTHGAKAITDFYSYAEDFLIRSVAARQ